MNPGLAQGFVKFNSVGYRVLKYLHEHGPSLAADIRRDASHSETSQISATIVRLRRNGFIHIVGRDRKPGKRSHPLFAIEPVRSKYLYVPIMTPAEKQKGYRERRKIKVASVFDYRGNIPINKETL
jgi:hypothetical protein